MLALALAAAFSLPDKPTHYKPDQFRQELRDSTARFFQALERLAASPLEREKIPQARAAVEASVLEARAVAARAAALDALDDEPLLEMAAGIEGTSRIKALAALRDSAAEPVARARGEQRGLARRLRLAEEKLERRRDRDPSRRALLEQARKDSARCDGILKEAEALLDGLEEARRGVVREFQDAAKTARELAKAAEEIAAAARAVEAAGPETLARVERLGQEPQAETRGRAGEAIRRMVDAGRPAYYPADVAVNRSDAFRGRQKKYLDAYRAFDRGWRSGPLAEAPWRAALAAAEESLRRLEQSLEKP